MKERVNALGGTIQILRIRDSGFLLQYPNVVEVDSDKDTVKRAYRL